MTKMSLAHLAPRIAAANRIWSRMPGWVRTDSALRELGKRFPGFDPEAVLLKAVTVNALYGTYVMAIVRMASHAASVIAKADLTTAGPELVERIAALTPSAPKAKARLHVSFASKFAHFFIDGNRFPIYDDRARVMLGVHLGSALVRMPTRPYAAFSENFSEFCRRVDWRGTSWEMDRYLWLAGSLRALKRDSNAQVNREIRDLTASEDRDTHDDLVILTAVDR